MTKEEIETYLAIKYGSVTQAHAAWVISECKSEFDDNIILTYIGYYLKKKVDKPD